MLQVAQAVLVPLLVNKDKVGPSSLRAIKSMMVMQPPPSFTVSPFSLWLPFLPLCVLTLCAYTYCFISQIGCTAVTVS